MKTKKNINSRLLFNQNLPIFNKHDLACIPFSTDTISTSLDFKQKKDVHNEINVIELYKTLSGSAELVNNATVDTSNTIFNVTYTATKFVVSTTRNLANLQLKLAKPIFAVGSLIIKTVKAPETAELLNNIASKFFSEKILVSTKDIITCTYSSGVEAIEEIPILLIVNLGSTFKNSYELANGANVVGNFITVLSNSPIYQAIPQFANLITKISRLMIDFGELRRDLISSSNDIDNFIVKSKLMNYTIDNMHKLLPEKAVVSTTDIISSTLESLKECVSALPNTINKTTDDTYFGLMKSTAALTTSFTDYIDSGVSAGINAISIIINAFRLVTNNDQANSPVILFTYVTKLVFHSSCVLINAQIVTTHLDKFLNVTNKLVTKYDKSIINEENSKNFSSMDFLENENTLEINECPFNIKDEICLVGYLDYNTTNCVEIVEGIS